LRIREFIQILRLRCAGITKPIQRRRSRPL
jgi:hypothetical protein